MAYVPGYTGDVFISYAHLDDQDGWVTEVKSKLASRLTSDLAGEPDIWFDERLRTGDLIKQEIHDKLSNTLMLVAIISPSFLKSQFCMEEELGWFLDNGGQEAIQLCKVPLAPDSSPPLLEARYETLHDSNGAAFMGEQLDSELKRIVWTIRQKMEARRQACDKVYLAQPQSDHLRSAARDLREALHRERLAVLPNEFLIQRTLESKIRKWIEDAKLSIHIRTNPPDPLAERQFRIAEKAGTPLMIVEGAPQKTAIPDLVSKALSMVASARQDREVYFIYDISDGEAASRLTKGIQDFSGGRKVTLPQPGETYHKAKLQGSDGVILFCQAAPRKWYDAQRQTLQQAAALRQGRIVPEACYVVQPGDPEGVVCNQPAPSRWEIERTGLPNILDLLSFFDLLKNAAVAGGNRV
jgi:hypothetical protein